MALTGTVSQHQDERLVVEELAADGDVSVGDDLTVVDGLAVGGTASVGGNLTVTGNLAASGLAVPATYLITLTASATPNAMNISIKPVAVNGTTPLSGINVFDVYLSGVNSGMGLTSTAVDDELTLVSGGGAVMATLVTKKMWRVATNASGEFVGIITDTHKPATEYVCVIHPLNGQPVVSGASGTKWGA